MIVLESNRVRDGKYPADLGHHAEVGIWNSIGTRWMRRLLLFFGSPVSRMLAGSGLGKGMIGKRWNDSTRRTSFPIHVESRSPWHCRQRARSGQGNYSRNTSQRTPRFWGAKVPESAISWPTSELRMGRWPTYMNENLTSVRIFDGVADYSFPKPVLVERLRLPA
jgi:hypothetical protein